MPSPEPIELCICTHNPRLGLLANVLRSVVAQDAAAGSFRVVLVDNASAPPVAEEVLAPLREAGIEARLLRESEPGLQRARLRAIHATASDWVLWVDDDNELFPDFIRRGLEFIAAHPEVGCFGGRLLLPAELQPAKWVNPFLPYLGIRDYGDDLIIARLQAWGPAEPAGAGAWVKRVVIDEYLRLAETSDSFFKLGRTGSSDLASCDDSCMMRCADTVGLACAYVPSLKLWHHLSPHRFRFRYLMKLMRAYGKSHVMLDVVMNVPAAPGRPKHGFGRLVKSVLYMFRTSLRQGLPFATSRVCYEYGAYKEHRRQQKLKPAEPAFDPSPTPTTPPKPKPLPKITVITACLNSVATIERTLKSVRDQEYPSLEYIVFDGASTDGTLEILRRHDGLITRLVSEKDSGVANAYNKGFALATGDVYCWINADDELAPGALLRIGRMFADDPQVDVITGGCRRVYADGSIALTEPPARYLQDIALRNGIEQPSTFWRASAHHAAGKLDETLALAFDWEWWNRLNRAGARFRSINDILSVYHFTDDNLTSRAGARVVDEMYRITKQYGPSRRGVAIADVYRFLFDNFDMKGYYDRPARELSLGRGIYFRCTLAVLRVAFGARRIKAYNWNWASKQIRGVTWYK